ncbi:MAG: DUF58 domain-containing protein [Solirubrobacterales bacterium]|nr:DUF58 domain-containing protein [Solirubrobacterales bacterium]
MPAAAARAVRLDLRRRAGGVLPGEHAGTGVGAGLELAQLRPYVPGDDVRRLDAAATARTGEPHVRLEVPERLLTTWIAVDVSASMGFGSAARLKSDVAEGVADLLAGVAVRRGGRVGLVACGTDELRTVAPRGGRLARVAVARLLADGVATDGQRGATTLADALARVARLATRPGLVAAVSDFRDGGDWARELRRLGLRHTLVAVEVGDPREAELPAVGTLTLVDPETGAQVEADTRDRRLRRRYAEAEARRRAEVRAQLRRAGARHVALSTAGDWAHALARELGRR